ncbi:MAG: hypothetical protein F6K47_34235 [Symploca sp. SIO2E6]|nr:hypothetical protein [Symploca sp. SIO2E6]
MLGISIIVEQASCLSSYPNSIISYEWNRHPACRLIKLWLSRSGVTQLK